MDKDIIDEETFLFIYKNVCGFNNIPWDDTDIDDEQLDGENYKIVYLINKLCKEIVVMTNRNQFPKDLKYLAIDLVENAYSVMLGDSDESTNQNIIKMTEGGRSVDFGMTPSWRIKYEKLLDQQLELNRTLINKYKLLYKVECPYAES